jgi:hypothetical protein
VTQKKLLVCAKNNNKVFLSYSNKIDFKRAVAYAAALLLYSGAVTV